MRCFRRLVSAAEKGFEDRRSGSEAERMNRLSQGGDGSTGAAGRGGFGRLAGPHRRVAIVNSSGAARSSWIRQTEAPLTPGAAPGGTATAAAGFDRR
jgi:hypothetical protein